jgi:predicted MFS family arabinose efflux permease
VSRRQAFWALAPVYLSVFLFVAGNSALSVLVPVYLSQEAHLGVATIGAVVGVFGFASLAARLPVGLAYSVSRAFSFLLAGGALSAAAFALAPFVRDPVAFGALMAVNGLGWSIATTAQLALLVARPPAACRRRRRWAGSPAQPASGTWSAPSSVGRPPT